MPNLLLLRHLQSQWNLENRFTGWTDVPLCQEGIDSAKKTAESLAGFKIDKVYTSPLIRNKETVSLILKELGKSNLPMVVNKALDERNYGQLQGLNKDEVKKQFGQEKVHLWRRSWDETPPGGESLKDVSERTIPFYIKYIENDLKEGKNILVVASHNSLRTIIKHIEKISNKDIINIEVAYGELRVYEFDKSLKRIILNNH
ncbi:MAG: 2,3-diphosphoglycerate-dependent phosphoglycerate mutase [Candidatus Nealsonbacteria bacterium]|nr:2,3-diphosphoglycerate-dependent phosphoglycerate mutase [Candidatus Nealsonbacteria bacterium]